MWNNNNTSDFWGRDLFGSSGTPYTPTFWNTVSSSSYSPAPLTYSVAPSWSLASDTTSSHISSVFDYTPTSTTSLFDSSSHTSYLSPALDYTPPTPHAFDYDAALPTTSLSYVPPSDRNSSDINGSYNTSLPTYSEDYRPLFSLPATTIRLPSL